MKAGTKREAFTDPQRTEPFYLTDCPNCGRHLGWRLHRIQRITCRYCGEIFVAEETKEIEKTS